MIFRIMFDSNVFTTLKIFFSLYFFLPRNAIAMFVDLTDKISGQGNTK